MINLKDLVTEGRLKTEDEVISITRDYLMKHYKQLGRRMGGEVEESMVELWRSKNIKTDRDLKDSIDYFAEDGGGGKYF